jgi:hypothetical protein
MPRALIAAEPLEVLVSAGQSDIGDTRPFLACIEQQTPGPGQTAKGEVVPGSDSENAARVRAYGRDGFVSDGPGS